MNKKTINFTFTFFYLSVKKIGCFKDTSRRAIPGVDGRGPLLTGYYRRRRDAIKKCALYALMYGFRAFAVQHQGWCATGSRAHVTYRKYGRSNRCRNGKGGPWANDVYRISGKSLVTCCCILLSLGGRGCWLKHLGFLAFDVRVADSCDSRSSAEGVWEHSGRPDDECYI